eukprot:TRINITY_DN66122_c12_g1_i1.p1 TRINITY_DN66122_c12_g1~~TRINITY_DN66122_c12_g1_i1.p1  ORF type:complete len:497 (+),score=61.95 TRINITY_DN66122_c12_g1_i1:67-1557(+)
MDLRHKLKLHFRSHKPEHPFDDLYTVTKSLGSGSYGEVSLCTEKSTGTGYADKYILKKRLNGRDDVRGVLMEAYVLSQLDHKHICRLHDFFEDGVCFHLVMEVMSGGDLLDRLTQTPVYTEAEAAALMKNLLSALAFMHHRGLCHRDVKPENLMLKGTPPQVASPNKVNTIDDLVNAEVQLESSKRDTLLSDVTLVDFGFATEFDSAHPAITDCCGTPNFMAPEVIQVGLYKSRTSYGPKCDVWSAGLIAFILLSGTHPFPDEAQARLFYKITKGQIKWFDAAWKKISKEGRAFVEKLLVVDPSKRLSAEEALQDPWIVNEGGGSTNLQGTLSDIREYNNATPKNKLKAAFFGVEATRFLMYMARCTERAVTPKNGLQEKMAKATEAMTTLNLSNEPLGNTELEAALGTLVANDSISKIELDNCHLDDSSVRVMANCLYGNSSVTALDLSNNPRITNTGAKELMKFMERHSFLTKVDLEGTTVSDSIQEVVNTLNT